MPEKKQAKLTETPCETGVVFSISEVVRLRELIEYAVCALQNESDYLGRRPRQTASDRESKEFLEYAAEELEVADALLESRSLAVANGRMH